MKKNVWYCLGLMSGTSLDGLDIAYLKFDNSEKLEFEILKAKTIPYSEEWRNKLKNAYYISALEITKLDVEYGTYIGNCINEFMTENEINHLDFVASHGQTIFHNPAEGYTLQIGNGATIAATCNQKIICNFRSPDVALGGQGAPLVPIGDKLLFSKYDYCINIGGFANISYDKNEVREAFDVCPANIVLNHYAEKMGFIYDDGGKIARSGTINLELLEKLNDLSCYQEKNSMGFEVVEGEIIPMIDSFNLSTETILATYTEHVALKISSILNPNSKSLFTGGGALNTYLIERIDSLSNSEIIIPNKQIIDFKEALIFGLLGLLKLENEINCLKSVTGARKDHSSGVIFNP
jgi:anhydro-N-acetylmuramic acid kinase